MVVTLKHEYEKNKLRAGMVATLLRSSWSELRGRLMVGHEILDLVI